MAEHWTAEAVLELMRGAQPACAVAAAAELDLFGALAGRAMTAEELAEAMRADPRATAVLADALAALGLLDKKAGRYSPAPGVADALTEGGSDSVVAMVRHQANTLRRWARLACVVQTGQPAPKEPGIRGQAGDLRAFIDGMNDLSRRTAADLVARLGPPSFRRLLDVGGGPGTWTAEFLRAAPSATAILFDLPEVIPIAREHLGRAGLLDRVALVPGSFQTDALPAGADLAWVSAIVHMNSRTENRALFAKVRAALAPGGQVLLRDVVMAPCRIDPPAGALFALTMLVGTPGGGTYTFEELAEDLRSAGFIEPSLLHRDPGMNSVVGAKSP